MHQIKREREAAAERASTVGVYRANVLSAYAEWKNKCFTAEKVPSEQQEQVLSLVHHRCLYEQEEETNHSINKEPSDDHWEPLFRLIHGLPGSGKASY